MKKTMIALATLLTFSASGVSAAEINVAVAANFTAPIKEISAIYEKESGNKILASFGATGAFYAQIKNGAPYQVLFAADAKTPKKIVAKVSVSTLNPTPSESWFSGAQQIISSNKIPTSSSPTPLRKSRLPIRS